MGGLIQNLNVFIILTMLSGMLSCDFITPGPVAENEILDGPIEGLTFEQNALFVAGDEAFGATFTSKTGLGPIFVATSCGSCHAGDGKGHPFTTLVRFGQADTTGNIFLTRGGPQLQNRAIPGHMPEQIPEGATSAKFTPPAVTGLGFLAALTDEQILANADPGDADGDGISGRPNYIIPPDYFQPQGIHQFREGKIIGRFGKKAAAVNLLHQTVNAYNEDMGITSDFRMEDPINYAVANQSADMIADPEVPAAVVRNVVFYLRTLKAPIRRNEMEPEVIRGQQLFSDLNCVACHLPEWKTLESDISVLSNQIFHPYTDLLLHDMGASLDDSYTEGIAMTSEWRTPPLWGLGLSKDAQGGVYYLLHDGRANSIEEAILFHGGEADGSRQLFLQLTDDEKEALTRFLESL